MDDIPPLHHQSILLNSSSSSIPSSSSSSSSLSYLPCLLCSSDTASSLPSPPSLDDSTKKRLRQHLIQFHSTVVASAFLHPNPLDSIHFWLMTCADYDVSTSSPIIDENDEWNNYSLQDILNVILGGGSSIDTINTVVDEKKRGLKRKVNDDNEYGINSEINIKKEEDNEIIDWSESMNGLNSPFNTLISDEIKKISSNNNNVQSSTDRICHLCCEESRYPGRHIAQKHLSKSLYECPICESFGSYEACTVQKHILKLHPDSGAEIISNLDKYSDEIRELQSKCFPNRPMKLVKSGSNSSRPPRERHNCRICNVQVAQSDRQRHVYHKHLCRERIFECPLCSFHSNYDIHRVKWHIKWKHPNESLSIDPISHENEYHNEIESLNEECFPGWQHRRKPLLCIDTIDRIDNDMISNDNTPSTTILDEMKEDDEMIVKDERKDNELIKNDENVKCQLCDKDIEGTISLVDHVVDEHMNILLYSCPLCHQGYHDESDIREHINKVHNDTQLNPISNMDKHSIQIQSIYSICFPGKTLKCIESVIDPSSSSSPSSTYHNRNINTPTFPLIVKEEEEDKVKIDEIEVSTLSIETMDCSNGSSSLGEDIKCQECYVDIKSEDRQIHVYRYHLKEDNLFECPLCSYSHESSSSDVRSHIRNTHKDDPDVHPRSNIMKLSNKINEWNEKCFPGYINRKLATSSLEDLNCCRICGISVRQTSRHIAQVHLQIHLHQCPLCSFGASESRQVKKHMKNVHKDDGQGMEPIANVVARRYDFSSLHDKCFPGRPKRLSNIRISEEGKRTKCKLCGGTYARKRRMNHLLQQHIQKELFKCSDCSFYSTFDEEVVAIHVRDIHDGDAATINTIQYNKDLIILTGKQCFPDWNTIDEELSTR